MYLTFMQQVKLMAFVIMLMSNVNHKMQHGNKLLNLLPRYKETQLLFDTVNSEAIIVLKELETPARVRTKQLQHLICQSR